MAKNNSKRVVVKKVGPIRRFFSITGAILTTAVVAGGTAMAIPQSRDAIGDWMASHFSPEYKQVSEQKDTLSITNDMYADQVTKLQTNISTATTEKTALETQLAAKTAEATQLQTQLTAKTVELEQLQAQLTAKTAEATQLQTQLAAKTTEITQLETQLETAQAEANQLQAQIEQLQQQLNTPSGNEETLQFGRYSHAMFSYEEYGTNGSGGYGSNYHLSYIDVLADGRFVTIDPDTDEPEGSFNYTMENGFINLTIPQYNEETGESTELTVQIQIIDSKTFVLNGEYYGLHDTKREQLINSIIAGKTAYEAAEARTSDYMNRLATANREKQQLQTDYNNLIIQMQNLQQSYNTVSSDLSELQTNYQQAVSNNQALQTQIDALQQQINTLQATVDSFEQVNITFANSWVSDYNSIIQSIIIHDNLTNRDYTITNTNFNTSPGVSVYSWQSVTFTFNNGIEASASTVYPDEYPITVTPGATGNIITVSGAPRAAIDITLTEVETITAIKNGETSQVNIVNGIVQGDDITSYDRLIINKNLKNFSIDTTMPQDNFLYYDGKYNDLANAIIDRSMNIQVPSNHYLIMRDLQTEKPTAYFINNGQSIFVGHFRADNPGKWSGGYSLFSTNYTLLSKGVMFIGVNGTDNITEFNSYYRDGNNNIHFLLSEFNNGTLQNIETDNVLRIYNATTGYTLWNPIYNDNGQVSLHYDMLKYSDAPQNTEISVLGSNNIVINELNIGTNISSIKLYAVNTINYNGTIAEWNNITKDITTGSVVVNCTDGTTTYTQEAVLNG